MLNYIEKRFHKELKKGNINKKEKKEIEKKIALFWFKVTESDPYVHPSLKESFKEFSWYEFLSLQKD